MATWGDIGKKAFRLAKDHIKDQISTQGPRVLKELSDSGPLGLSKQAIADRLDKLTASTASDGGRPVTRTSKPTKARARTITYRPDLDGMADPGEIVWTWVVYEDDPSQGKDRPVLVVGRERSTVLGLMLSSQDKHDHDPHWLHLGSGPWSADGEPSWVRLDRVLDVPEAGIRREGAILDRHRFEEVAAALRSRYGWR